MYFYSWLFVALDNNHLVLNLPFPLYILFLGVNDQMAMYANLPINLNNDIKSSYVK